MTLEAQDNPFTSILMVEAADPEALSGDADPAAGQRRLVVGTDHILYLLSDSGVKTAVGGGGIANPLATDSLWDAAGDLVQGSGANTAAKLSAGTAGKVLTSNGAAAALTWETPGTGAVATDAIWDTAGDLAVGSGANTAAKLVKGAAGANLSSYNGVVGWNGGTSFPASPATGDRYWRSDLALEFYYSGTNWLSTQIFSINNALGTNVTATAYVPLSTTMSPVFFLPSPDKLGGSDIWLVNSTFKFYLAAGTALSASHKWVVTTGKVDSANSNTVVATHTIDSGASTTWREDSQAIGALMNNGTTRYSIYLTATKTGTPGNIYPQLQLTYRIVAT